MKKLHVLALGGLISLILSSCGSENNEKSSTTEINEQSKTGSELVKLPENYNEGVLYATVKRGNVDEKIYTSQETIEAVKKGQPIPSGTVITLEIYRDGDLSQIFVSEKRTDWGEQIPPEKRNGDWRYQAFTADKSVDYKGDIARCISCHASVERDDFVYTMDDLKNYEPKDLLGAMDDSTGTRSIEEWKVNALADYLVNIRMSSIEERG